MKIVNILCLLPLLTLSGCALSEDLSPPPDGQAVKISVVKPIDIDILPMKIIYRSEKCRDKIFTSTGALSSRAGYHLLTVPFKPGTGNDTVSNSIALDGGGQCEWKLSNIRFQFKFSDMLKFGMDIKQSVSSDIVFVFDRNAPPRGDGHYEDVYGDVIIDKDYYPLVVYDRYVKHRKYVQIKGEELLTYRMHNVKSVIFKPNVHSMKIINVLGPKEFGGDFIITYPDGTKTTDKEEPDYPDFKKLKMMK
ncbi:MULTISPECIES: hypothetical protein [Serratia]|uniref:Lipoprotein n=1 Tax=Serratia quinivorans TaxID=137545 RepID=A0A379ZY81_9GAMM|nr:MULTISPECIES: hypothetical protein [Serratia]RYM57791.1 hypothetical protein BSR03_23535 [Serratia proteamaculans]CAI1881003.1 Uncharacterised protein [Serratia quinivorans]SUI70549.1 Uncharacterised protein [Serratia quinivorans]